MKGAFSKGEPRVSMLSSLKPQHDLLKPRAKVKAVIQAASTCANEFGWNPSNDRHWRHILCNDTAAGNHRTSADPNARQDGCSRCYPDVIFNNDIAAGIRVRVVVNVVFQCPNVGLLCDIHIIANDQAATASIQEHILVDHHAIPDKDVSSISQFDAHKNAYSRS
jgi:hypothetical protein